MYKTSLFQEIQMPIWPCRDTF